MGLRLKPVNLQVIVITGATSGIGLATARLASRRGARVVLVGRSARALRQLAAELHSGGGGAIAVQADVTNPDEVEHVAAEAIRAFGVIDTWVNNAAVSAYGRCLEVSLADMRQIVETNFWGTVYGSRTACRHLAERGGALINMGSVLSDHAVPMQGIYSATKHAMKGWTDALRAELSHDHIPIAVTLIKPAAIATPYAEHAKNYFEDQPTHVPPVYSPRSVARAVLYAAEHPVRELVVGSAAKILALGGQLAPGITDTLLNRLLVPGMHSGRAPHGRPALFEPTEDLRERGEYRGIARPSVYTALATTRRRTRLAAAAALAATFVAVARGRT